MRARGKNSLLARQKCGGLLMSYGMLQHNVDEEQFRPFTVTSDRSRTRELKKRKGQDDRMEGGK